MTNFFSNEFSNSNLWWKIRNKFRINSNKRNFFLQKKLNIYYEIQLPFQLIGEQNIVFTQYAIRWIKIEYRFLILSERKAQNIFFHSKEKIYISISIWFRNFKEFHLNFPISKTCLFKRSRVTFNKNLPSHADPVAHWSRSLILHLKLFNKKFLNRALNLKAKEALLNWFCIGRAVLWSLVNTHSLSEVF